MNVAFRLDAIHSVGIGHLMRCLALSEELYKRKHTCYFLSKIDNDQLIKKIQNTKAICVRLKTDLTKKEDLKTLIKFSKENNIDWIITDNYKIDTYYIKQIKKNGFKVLSIDDTSQMHYHSDIVLNQNIGSEKLDFSTEEKTRVLLGSNYVMMRDELLKRDNNKENKDVKKILVTLGGADPDNLTVKILRLLETVDESIEILVIAGPFNPFFNEIQDYAKKSKHKTRLIKAPENMAEIYLDSDMAISAGGSSCYELAYFGIPNLIITMADNQLNIAAELDKRNVSIYLGKKQNIKAEKWEEKISNLLKNHSLRQSMSQNGKRLIDGKGKQRIVDFMERPVYGN